MLVPNCTYFKLITRLYNVPAGATGQLKRPDSYHVALIFDNYEDFVFDINDTGPEVWAAIMPTVNPSMVDPPMFGRKYAMAAAILVAFIVGWTIDPPLSVANAQAAVEYLELMIFPM
jgi:hypothetical protein